MAKDEQAGASSAAAAEEECAITNFAAVCIRHRHSQYTGGTDTAVQPSVGRQNRVHWKHRTEPKAIAVDWLGSASPSAGRF
ncbi:unnamed protein product [Sphagnum jensenii]|uniref:Uncharacterized protein n=1 Tax=Sphagnum jensenii TaxID=128206 RepID=A0ABP1B0S9_9BRYO